MFEPDIETRSAEDQRAIDDTLFRRQVAYLFENSRFYQSKLSNVGFSGPDDVGGLDNVDKLPFTEKDELRASRSESEPIGTHLAVPMERLVRIFSTSGTTGTPSYIPLTEADLDNWIRTSSRTYAASGLQARQRIVSTYNAGPFVAGVALDAFNRLGLCHIPVGLGNTERLMAAVQKLSPQIIALTPSYALHLAEWATQRGIDLPNSSVERLMVAGEPGGGEAALRAQLEDAWGAQVTEAMGIGDITASLWGECPQQHGMHFSGRGYVHFELIDPDTGEAHQIEDGARGELVLTHLNHEAAPLLRFRTRDHVQIFTEPCACGRMAPRVRCIGRTDDMLIVRGVNLFPSAVREVVNEFRPRVSGVISLRPTSKGVKQTPPLRLVVELAEGVSPDPNLAQSIKTRIRDTLLVTTVIELAAWGSLQRSEYKSKLIDWSEAKAD